VRFREKAVGESFYREGNEVALEWPTEQAVSRTGPPDTEVRVPVMGIQVVPRINSALSKQLRAFYLLFTWN